MKKPMLRVCQSFVSWQGCLQDLMNVGCLLEDEQSCSKSVCLIRAQKVFHMFRQGNICNLNTEKVLSSMQFSAVR